MKIINVRRYIYRWAIPLIILVGVFLSGVYFLSDRSDSPAETYIRLLHGLLMTGGLWIGCILIVTWLWKKYPWQEAPVRHLVYEVILIFIYTILYAFLLYKLEVWIFDYSVEINFIYDGFTTLLITYFITAIHEAAFFYRQWSLHFSKSVKLEKDNIEANYEALKNQVNPHFLFNSLNSLTGMVEEKPEAVQYISNLSEFLRYLLKSNEKELVELEIELEIVNKYVDIQKSRFGDSLKLFIDIPGYHKKKLMPPLTLQMLVENCIKHNAITRYKPLQIKIYSEDEKLVIENNLNPKSGIMSTRQGLKNISERYALFTSYALDVIREENSFKVKVPLLMIES